MEQPAQGPSNNSLVDFFMFRTMVTPTLIVVIYLLGVVGVTVAALYLVAAGDVLSLIIFWVLGQLYLRVALEVLIVLFRLYESVRNIERLG